MPSLSSMRSCLLRRWMLEVTGGSMATVFRQAGGDFPAIYQVGMMHARVGVGAAWPAGFGARMQAGWKTCEFRQRVLESWSRAGGWVGS